MIENMKEETFSDLGRVEAISRLYEGTPYKPFQDNRFETDGKSFVTSQSRTFMEGVDFDLVYFPLKHLGYKCVTAVTGELYASFSHPRTMDIRLGISSKLDFAQIRELGLVLLPPRRSMVTRRLVWTSFLHRTDLQ
jgi:thiamine-monophosphate kinase